MLVGVLIIMFKYSWKLTLICLAANSPLIFFTRISFYFTNGWQNELQKAKAVMCSFAEESLSNIRTVKAFADEKQCFAKYNSESIKVYEWANRMAKLWGFFMGQLQILGAGSLAIVCFSASVLYKNQEISLGTITAFLLYMRSFQEIAMSITNNL